MTLSPQALNALILVKSHLLSNMDHSGGEQKAMELSTDRSFMGSKTVTITVSSPLNHSTSTTSTVRMRHAKGSTAFQRMCRRHDWASPVY